MDRPGTDPPIATNAPPVRCFQQTGDPCRPVCGELAQWYRPGSSWFAAAYFCDPHHLASDLPIPDEHVFRRVRILCDVTFAGVSTNAPLAQLEAVARLEQCIGNAGGRLEVCGVRSLMVQSGTQAHARLTIADRESLE